MTIVSWLNLYLQVDALKDVPKVLLPQYSQEKFIQIAQVGSKALEDGSWGSDKPNWVLHPESHFVLSVPLFPLACYFVKEHASLTPPKKFSFEDKYPCVSCLPFLYAGKIKKIHFISLITGHSSILWRAVTPLRRRWIISDSRLFVPVLPSTVFLWNCQKGSLGSVLTILEVLWFHLYGHVLSPASERLTEAG